MTSGRDTNKTEDIEINIDKDEPKTGRATATLANEVETKRSKQKDVKVTIEKHTPRTREVTVTYPSYRREYEYERRDISGRIDTDFMALCMD